MKNIIYFCALFLLTMQITNANSNEFTIEMLNKRDDGQKMVYSKDIINVEINDTIKWVPTSRGHNIEFITVPDGIVKQKKSKVSKEYSYAFEQPGIYLYQCSPHKSMGMIGLVVVSKDISNIYKIAISKVFGMSKKKLAKLVKEINS